MAQEQEMMAACGLLCGPCSIRRMPFDDSAAKGVVKWFKEMGWLKEDKGVEEAIEKEMYCRGCHGDRSIHWSPDCWILKCCVDDKELEYCYECGDFPCDRLVDWSKKKDSYAAGLERLKQLHSHGAKS